MNFIKSILTTISLAAALTANCATACAEHSPGQSEQITLDRLGDILYDEVVKGGKPLRLAVVFSGGGAKCSYQVGAVKALEEKLAELRERSGNPAFDLSLVVGTSGGALNALPVALGVSAIPKSFTDYSKVWENLDQRDLIRPSREVRTLMIFWFVCVQGLVVLRVRRHRHFKNPEKYPWIISRAVITIGILQIAIARAPYKPWSILGENSNLHHLWLWLSWGLEGSGIALIGIGITSLVLRRIPRVQYTPFLLRYRYARRAFWLGAIFIPLIQAYNVLFVQTTLSDGGGIERAVLRNFVGLIDSHLANQNLSPLGIETDTYSHETMERIGEEVMRRGLLHRDLVLTGSALPTLTNETARDIYFYAASSGSSDQPQFASSAISLNERPKLLMDALIGSGAIYPVFPARVLKDVRKPGEVIELIDGSFEHRSPVEAAARWGATHIILIQATTDEIIKRGALIENMNAALNHLYDEAQLVDIRSRELVESFTLVPTPPHIGLLDFADNLIRKSIDKGYREARGLTGESGVGTAPNWRWRRAKPPVPGELDM